MIIGLRGPAWLYGLDAVIQFLGAIIALVVSFYGYKAYKLTSNKRYLYFCIAFAFIFIDLIIFSITIPSLYFYYKAFGDIYAGKLLNIFSDILTFIYIFSTLMAYTLFIFIYSRIQNKSLMSLLVTLVFALTIYSFTYSSIIGFNLISAILLFFVVFYTSKNWIRNKKLNPLLVFLTFTLITIAHFSFVLSWYQNVFYVFAHVAQLIGYLSLFILFMRLHNERT